MSGELLVQSRRHDMLAASPMQGCAYLLGEPPALVVLLPELIQSQRLADAGLLRGELRLQRGSLLLERRQPRARVGLLCLLLRRQLRRLRRTGGASFRAVGLPAVQLTKHSTSR